MIYLFRWALDMLFSFTGAWWSRQQQMDLEPLLATAGGGPIEDDDGPLPEEAGADRPRCTLCGDPNYSLESEICIACRIGGVKRPPAGEPA